jgi:hypothetical protein
MRLAENRQQRPSSALAVECHADSCYLLTTAFTQTLFNHEPAGGILLPVPSVDSKTSWYGYAPGTQPSFYHSWYLQPKGSRCHVVMDEAGIGKDVAALRQSDETLMHRGHDLWLATLKWVAEAK